MGPEKGKHRAIAEVPTDSKDDGDGIADYVLFVGVEPYTVVEAKKKNKKVPSYQDQAKRYARGLAAVLPITMRRTPRRAAPLQSARRRPAAKPADARCVVSFLYSMNGRPYLRQVETESGVWFLDLRDPSNLPRALTGWHAPDVLVSARRTSRSHSGAPPSRPATPSCL